MPAFGKDGIVNIDESKKKEMWQLVKSDGTVVASGDKEFVEGQKQNLSQQLNCDLQIKKVVLQCL